MVWGWMGWEGVEKVIEVEGRMNAEQYVDILGNNLLESLESLGFDAEVAIFQEDNNPKHTSKLAIKWFNDHDINMKPSLTWILQSGPGLP